jgi:hypothetical protein
MSTLLSVSQIKEAQRALNEVGRNALDRLDIQIANQKVTSLENRPILARRKNLTIVVQSHTGPAFEHPINLGNPPEQP